MARLTLHLSLATAAGLPSALHTPRLGNISQGLINDPLGHIPQVMRRPDAVRAAVAKGAVKGQFVDAGEEIGGGLQGLFGAGLGVAGWFVGIGHGEAPI